MNGRFLHIHPKLQTKSNYGNVKSTLKDTRRHSSFIPIKIKGHSIAEQTACFISNQESTKVKDPNITIVNGIHNIKGKTSVNILALNYSNKHVTFNKGEYIGHLELTLENIEEEKNLHTHKNPNACDTYENSGNSGDNSGILVIVRKLGQYDLLSYLWDHNTSMVHSMEPAKVGYIPETSRKLEYTLNRSK